MLDKLLRRTIGLTLGIRASTDRWWDQWLARLENSQTKLILIRARNVKSVYGQKVSHFAHKADVIRLEALKYYGGIYLDSDVIVLQGMCRDSKFCYFSSAGQEN
jgi:hypothetical protein